MRYSAVEKEEIIRLVEQSSLPVRQTLVRLNIRKSTFYGWLKRVQTDGVSALEDNKPSPGIPWNRLPQEEQTAVLELALEKPELSPRELAVTYIDQKNRFVSESTVYRLLKSHDLITSPTYILMQAADKFQHPTTRVNEMWQTDFTHCKVIGLGLVLPVNDIGRLLTLCRCLAAMHDYEHYRCHRYSG